MSTFTRACFAANAFSSIAVRAASYSTHLSWWPVAESSAQYQRAAATFCGAAAGAAGAGAARFRAGGCLAEEAALAELAEFSMCASGRTTLPAFSQADKKSSDTIGTPFASAKITWRVRRSIKSQT